MKHVLIALFLVVAIFSHAQNKSVGVGTTTPNLNAALDVVSPTNNQGLLLPRLSTAQRNAMSLSTSDKGMIVFDSDQNLLLIWDGTGWGVPAYGAIRTTNDNAGSFEIKNASSSFAGVFGETNGNGPAIMGSQIGSGRAGQFQITNPSNSEIALRGYTDGTGSASKMTIDNAANSNAALLAETIGTGAAGSFINNNTTSATNAVYSEIKNNVGGTAVNGISSGTAGLGGYFEITNAANSYAALQGKTSGIGAALLGETSTGWTSIFGKQTSSADFKNAIVGQHDGTGKGHAGLFQITKSANSYPALQAETIGGGPAGYFIKNNTTVNSAALAAETKSNVGGAAINGYATGTAGVGGAFDIINTANAYAALQATTKGTGVAGAFEIDNASNGNSALFSKTNGTGTSISGETATGWTSIYGKNNSATTGHAGYFEIANASNSSDALKVTTIGTGKAGEFIVNNPSAGNNAILATTNANTIYSAIQGFNTGIGNPGPSKADGSAGTFTINNLSSPANALCGLTNGTGAALFALHAGGSGNIAVFASWFNNAPTTKARIDKDGVGYFNGGTQSSGADVAEMFEVEGAKNEYEPGDVLVISESTDRTVEKCSSQYSTKVVGVYATKPGVTLTEKGIEESLEELVPMGVIGVIPTKVSLENGPIKRGDLLVTSSTPGRAMKAISKNGEGVFPSGVILGKALENFDGTGNGLIKVMVNVK